MGLDLIIQLIGILFMIFGCILIFLGKKYCVKITLKQKTYFVEKEIYNYIIKLKKKVKNYEQ